MASLISKSELVGFGPAATTISQNGQDSMAVGSVINEFKNSGGTLEGEIWQKEGVKLDEFTNTLRQSNDSASKISQGINDIIASLLAVWDERFPEDISDTYRDEVLASLIEAIKWLEYCRAILAGMDKDDPDRAAAEQAVDDAEDKVDYWQSLLDALDVFLGVYANSLGKIDDMISELDGIFGNSVENISPTSLWNFDPNASGSFTSPELDASKAENDKTIDPSVAAGIEGGNVTTGIDVDPLEVGKLDDAVTEAETQLGAAQAASGAGLGTSSVAPQNYIPTPDVSMVYSDNPNIVETYNSLHEAGLKDSVIAALMGNADFETMGVFDVGNVNADSSNSCGLYRFTDNREVQNMTAFLDYCDENNLDPAAISSSNSFALYDFEQRFPEQYAEVMSLPDTPEGARRAGEIFARFYEAPGYDDTHRSAQVSSRGRSAEEFFNQIKAGEELSSWAEYTKQRAKYG